MPGESPRLSGGALPGILVMLAALSGMGILICRVHGLEKCSAKQSLKVTVLFLKLHFENRVSRPLLPPWASVHPGEVDALQSLEGEGASSPPRLLGVGVNPGVPGNSSEGYASSSKSTWLLGFRRAEDT